MRKSQSALELGAWKKIAAGDLDFVDPSGSVREQLQGLDYLQVGAVISLKFVLSIPILACSWNRDIFLYNYKFVFPHSKLVS